MNFEQWAKKIEEECRPYLTIAHDQLWGTSLSFHRYILGVRVEYWADADGYTQIRSNIGDALRGKTVRSYRLNPVQFSFAARRYAAMRQRRADTAWEV